MRRNESLSTWSLACPDAQANCRAYLDVSEAEFEGLVARGEMPDAITLGRRRSWSKQAIDSAIALISEVHPNASIEIEKEDWRSRQPLYSGLPEEEKWWLR